MAEPLVSYSGNGAGATVRQGPPCNVGQRRIDPAYPDLLVRVTGRYTETHWRVNYETGGFAVLPEETIRALYPDIIEPGEA